MSRAVVAKEKVEYCYRQRNLKKSGTSARYVQAHTIKTAQSHCISPFTLTLLLTSVYLCITLTCVLCMSSVMCIVTETTEETGETAEQ